MAYSTKPKAVAAREARWAAGVTPRRQGADRVKIQPGWHDEQVRKRTAARYGLTLEEYDERTKTTTCDICGGPTLVVGARFKRPSIDHDHETGKVRGMICRNCNSMLGLAGDDPTTLRTAAEYIERYKMTAL